MTTYFVVFIASALFAVLLTPLVVRFARSIGAVDRPGVRKIHARAIPRLGGIAIIVPVISLCSAVFLLDNSIGEEFRGVRARMLALLATSVVVFAAGLWDDIRGLSARAKFGVEVTAALLMCSVGVVIRDLHIGGMDIDFGALSIPLTVLWIVGVTNAVNLIDGLDGLATGISLITCSVLATVAIFADRPVMAVLMLAMLGSLSGFLCFNFNPARIFLGDCGSLVLGYALAVSSIITSHKTTTVLAITLPFLALGIPIFDTFFSMLRRLLGGRSLFSPDKGHIHHRLLERGLNQRRAVLTLYGVTAAVVGLGFLMVFTDSVGQLLFLALALLFLIAFFRMSGVISVGEIYRAVRHSQSLARDIRDGRRSVEESELRLREAKSVEDWWDALCGASESLGFVDLKLVVILPTTMHLAWAAPSTQTGARRMTVSFELHGPAGEHYGTVECTHRGGTSWESATMRGAILGRLLDRYASQKKFASLLGVGKSLLIERV